MDGLVGKVETLIRNASRIVLKPQEHNNLLTSNLISLRPDDVVAVTYLSQVLKPGDTNV